MPHSNASVQGKLGCSEADFRFYPWIIKRDIESAMTKFNKSNSVASHFLSQCSKLEFDFIRALVEKLWSDSSDVAELLKIKVVAISFPV